MQGTFPSFRSCCFQWLHLSRCQNRRRAMTVLSFQSTTKKRESDNQTGLAVRVVALNGRGYDIGLPTFLFLHVAFWQNVVTSSELFSKSRLTSLHVGFRSLLTLYIIRASLFSIPGHVGFIAYTQPPHDSHQKNRSPRFTPNTGPSSPTGIPLLEQHLDQPTVNSQPGRRLSVDVQSGQLSLL